MVADVILKIITGFCILLVTFLIGYALWEFESTWPLFLGVGFSWLVGHLIFPPDTTTPPLEVKFKPETDEDLAKYEEIKKFAEEYVAKQHSDVYKYQRARETAPPFQNHPLLRNTTYNQQQQPLQRGRVTDGFESLMLGGIIGYELGSNHSSHSSGASDSCSSSNSYESSSSYDSGSFSSDSSSYGGD
jgi:hypothetical protein